MEPLAKGDVQNIGKLSGCTRQYASEVISDYRKGTVRRGRKAAKVIKAYKSQQDKYRNEIQECNERQKTTHFV